MPNLTFYISMNEFASRFTLSTGFVSSETLALAESLEAEHVSP